MKKNKDFLPLNVENHMLDTQDLESSTEFASAERSSVEELIRQNKEWSAQQSTQVLSDAIPDLLLILNQNRQIVYSNGNCVKFGRLENASECLGLRPGELLNCKHAFESKGGCGTTKFCSTCGAAKAILESLNGKKDVEECKIDRRNDQSMMELRVWTTPVQLSGEQFSVFTVHDISIEKEHARLLERVQKLAILDPLTEVFNRRAFFEAANREIIRAVRYHNPFSIIMVDLDRFKMINDTYGHPAGDAVIKEITRLIQRNLREIDTLARYGGDEFIILLPETGLVGGQKVADRIMQASDEDVYLYKDFEIPMSFSAGIAEYQFELDHDIDDVISRADKELYQIKSKRRQIHID